MDWADIEAELSGLTERGTEVAMCDCASCNNDPRIKNPARSGLCRTKRGNFQRRKAEVSE